jgi:hypothetical protein
MHARLGKSLLCARSMCAARPVRAAALAVVAIAAALILTFRKGNAEEGSIFKPITPYWLSDATPAAAVLPADAERNPEPLPDAPVLSLTSDLTLYVAEVGEPGPLGRPILPAAPEEIPTGPTFQEMLTATPRDAPLGYAGPSGVLPTEFPESEHFIPIEDRWRIGFPEWDRYDRGHPPVDDYPYVLGQKIDPYNQNVLKGDYPLVGQHTFFNVTASTLMVQEYRTVPTGTTPFESTLRPFSEEFFGDPDQYFYTQFFVLAFDFFHGSAAFKPFDWRIRLEPVFDVNVLDADELAVIHPDVCRGTTRERTYTALEQWFVEAKLADLSPDYDFASVRAGSQLFVSDFRGFVFRDINRGVRLFGTRYANRDQFNVIWFDQTEKDTNSMLNEFNDRHQNTVIANYFRQDFVFPGFTALVSFHYNHDQPSFHFDDNAFLARPDPAGVFRPHRIKSYYIGLGGDGHIGRVNVSTQFYQVLGTDSLNPIGGQPQDINAQMAALELSIDRDWVRFRTSYFFASGDQDPNDRSAEGFDAIFDNPIFAGGEFSYWQRQAIKLFGVNLVQRQSLVPNLRSSKIEGQTNFVNPGLHLANLGMDFEVTPKLRVITNANYLWFDETQVLEVFTFQDHIGRDIGTDLSVGVEYRPLLNDNVIFVAGSAVLIPSSGLRDLFGKVDPFTIDQVAQREVDLSTLNAHFMEMILTY